MSGVLALALGIAAAVLAAGLAVECLVRLYLEWPLATSFYGSLPRERVRDRQREHGVQVVAGAGWVHLGWIADPERERYRVEWREAGTGPWRSLARTTYGSLLHRGAGGDFRVLAVRREGGGLVEVGAVRAEPAPGTPPRFTPRIAGPWQTLFRPARHGSYVNDHAVFRDARGDWRLLGITGPGDGDLNQERHFAVGVSRSFPPDEGMREAEPVADFGELAWAPHVVRNGDTYHLFWSPHRLHEMTSRDGIRWEGHRIAMAAPVHRFFRDAMVLKVAERQWLLYCTARGRYYSRVDVYQSFDLRDWQYIRAALATGWGSERNSPFASTESPCVTPYAGRYYLSLTYNNDSFFWPGVLLLWKRWPNRRSYNETLVFHADNPYDFGTYRGRRNAPTLLTELEAHAPRLVQRPEDGAWYVTTAGWPWAATLTSGEVAVAPLAWDPLQPSGPEPPTHA
ncbi:MAG: hypothetical protein JSU66_13435 [Deltaproteobacteria bacterium]|nr:MAG: hypothetical protein JSU66_13435 [Deltaproteobacteria bacterium]